MRLIEIMYDGNKKFVSIPLPPTSIFGCIKIENIKSSVSLICLSRPSVAHCNSCALFRRLKHYFYFTSNKINTTSKTDYCTGFNTQQMRQALVHSL